MNCRRYGEEAGISGNFDKVTQILFSTERRRRGNNRPDARLDDFIAPVPLKRNNLETLNQCQAVSIPDTSSRTESSCCCWTQRSPTCKPSPEVHSEAADIYGGGSGHRRCARQKPVQVKRAVAFRRWSYRCCRRPSMAVSLLVVLKMG